MRLIVSCVGIALLSACSFIELSDAGKVVELRSAQEVASCESKGTTTTQVLDKIIFKREQESMAAELADLARNRAAEMGGDTIVPTSEIAEGKQSFAVYRCR